MFVFFFLITKLYITGRNNDLVISSHSYSFRIILFRIILSRIILFSSIYYFFLDSFSSSYSFLITELYVAAKGRNNDLVIFISLFRIILFFITSFRITLFSIIYYFFLDSFSSSYFLITELYIAAKGRNNDFVIFISLLRIILFRIILFSIILF